MGIGNRFAAVSDSNPDAEMNGLRIRLFRGHQKNIRGWVGGKEKSVPNLIGYTEEKGEPTPMLPKRILGKTGVEISCIGLGGEGILRTHRHEREARAVIDRALDLGINYMESARAYNGSEAYYGLNLGSKRDRVFLVSKAHARTAAVALEQLEESLRQMKTDWLDLWQIHDVRTEKDLDGIFSTGGVLGAFLRAKRDGKVRFIGITGHQNPDVLLQAIKLFDFDAVMLPVNPAEQAWMSFPGVVVPEARQRGMGIIGMKVFCRGFGLQLRGLEDPARWLRYALAYDLSTAVVGCDNPEQVEESVAAAQMPPLTAQECRSFEKDVSPWARRLMFYKSPGPRHPIVRLP
jgi:aryl-alcohol dehydrogenase-like predicted oxidoreductase